MKEINLHNPEEVCEYALAEKLNEVIRELNDLKKEMSMHQGNSC